jgi:hypothetical protein
VSLWAGESIMAFNQHYQVGMRGDGRPAQLMVPKNIVEPKPGQPYLCGLADFLERPKGRFDYPWRGVLIGHKNSDEDQIAGKVPLHVDVRPGADGEPDAYFPLRWWTDKDVWEYTEECGLPVQGDRYAKGSDGTDGSAPEWRELEEKATNSDYWPACIKCIDRREGDVVRCPKLGGMATQNVSSRVLYVDIKPDYFGQRDQLEAGHNSAPVIKGADQKTEASV